MFDFFARWPDDFERPNRFAVDPPKAVVVALGAILPPHTAPRPIGSIQRKNNDPEVAGL